MVLIAVATVDMMGGAMVFPLLPFYALKFHASPTTIGMIIASFFIAQLVSAPLWGRVSDRYGRRPALLIALKTKDRLFRESVVMALRRIDPETAAKAGL